MKQSLAVAVFNIMNGIESWNGTRRELFEAISILLLRGTSLSRIKINLEEFDFVAAACK